MLGAGGVMGRQLEAAAQGERMGRCGRVEGGPGFRGGILGAGGIMGRQLATAALATAAFVSGVEGVASGVLREAAS